MPDCISNVTRLLETVLQNSDTCRIFIEKKGIECVLQLFSLPFMPFTVSLGQSIAVAFKNFSPQYSASLARAVCSFLREHLKLTDELLSSISGSQLAQVEVSQRVKILKGLSTLDGILSLSNSLLKRATTIVSELGSESADTGPSNVEWGIERDFIYVVRSSEGLSRRSRHSSARLRSGRTGRHLEALQVDSKAGPSSVEAPEFTFWVFRRASQSR